MPPTFLTSHKIRASSVSAASGVLPRTSAATGGAYVSDVVDMQGFDSIVFFCQPAATGAARATMKVRCGSATDSLEDLTGTALTSTAIQQLIVAEVIRPPKRYMQGSVTATGGIIGNIYYIQSMARDKPVSNTVAAASGVISEISLSPATGTA